MSVQRTFNICENWCLKCLEVTELPNGIRLSCALNPKKRDDNTYGKGVYISVICSWQSCDIPEDDYTDAYIDVWGGIQVSEYLSKKDNEYHTSLTIFADKVRKHVWNNT